MVYVIPTVPFWPWRLANLSPTWGMRTERTCTETAGLFVEDLDLGSGSPEGLWGGEP